MSSSALKTSLSRMRLEVCLALSQTAAGLPNRASVLMWFIRSVFQNSGVCCLGIGR
ncbi:MAG: hypothetical protein QXX19_07190 [Candidatus Caldarchaeum sp.]